MKKIICIILLCILPVVALADLPDLSAYTFDDLMALRIVLNKEIMSRPEWKEVRVPAGNWVVGVDIPVGFYSIKATEDYTIIDLENKEGHFVFYNVMDKGDSCGKAEFAEGSTLSVNSTVILAPPVSLGF